LAIEMLYISHEFFPLIVQLIKSWKCGKFKAKYSKLCSLHQRLKNIFPPHMRAPIYGKWSKSLSALDQSEGKRIAINSFVPLLMS